MMYTLTKNKGRDAYVNRSYTVTALEDSSAFVILRIYDYEYIKYLKDDLHF